MESVVNQFRLFVEDGELDPDPMAITSDPVPYKRVPSLLDGKYVYPTDGDEIAGILHVLFSDQSTLNYINEDLKGVDVAGLLVDNEVTYDDFHEYQKQTVDHLIGLGILEDTGPRVRIANRQQFFILKSPLHYRGGELLPPLGGRPCRGGHDGRKRLGVPLFVTAH